jgi:hypothetical protein
MRFSGHCLFHYSWFDAIRSIKNELVQHELVFTIIHYAIEGGYYQGGSELIRTCMEIIARQIDSDYRALYRLESMKQQPLFIADGCNVVINSECKGTFASTQGMSKGDADSD